MTGNNNRGITALLSDRKAKASPLRYYLTVLSIILTATLLSATLSVVSGMINAYQHTMFQAVGTSAHGGFKYLSEEAYRLIKEHPGIQGYGKTVIIGNVVDERLLKRNTEIHYYDQYSMEKSFILPLLKGEVPQARNEVVIDTLVLDVLGLPYETGQTLNLDVLVNGRTETMAMVISGIYEGTPLAMSSLILVSEELADEAVRQRNWDIPIEEGNYYGLIQMNVDYRNTFMLQEKGLKVLEDLGLEDSTVKVATNWAYLGNSVSFNMQDIVAFILFIVLLMFGGYLIIYNIFYIGILNDLRFYGLLKTTGATGTQIKGIVLRQGIKLSVIGIPIGLVVGFVISKLAFPYIIVAFNIGETPFRSSPMVFLIAGVLSLVTVLISCLRPAAMASKISAVSAVKADSKTIGALKSTGSGLAFRLLNKVPGGSVGKMALANVLRLGKKGIILSASITLSLILFIVAYNFADSVDEEAFVSFMIPSDMIVADAKWYQYDYLFEPVAVGSDLVASIGEVDDIDINNVYLTYGEMPMTDTMKDYLESESQTSSYASSLLSSGNQRVEVYGVDQGLYDLLGQYVTRGKIDWKVFESGGYVILLDDILGNDTGIKNAEVGEVIELIGADGQENAYEVIAFVDHLPYYLYDLSATQYCTSVYMAASEYKKVYDEDTVMLSALDFNDTNGLAEAQVNRLLESNPRIVAKTRRDYSEKSRSTTIMFQVIGYSVSGLLGLIALLNFVNVFASAVVVRRHELATMQSIGMTTRQLKKMLIYEGLFLTLLATAIAGVISYPVSDILIGNMKFSRFEMTYLPLLWLSPLLLIMVYGIPVLTHNRVSRERLIDRLAVPD